MRIKITFCRRRPSTWTPVWTSYDREPMQLVPRDTADTNNETRKLSYHKDDRAMCPIYWCPENFRESLSRPTSTATFPEIFNLVLFRLLL